MSWRERSSAGAGALAKAPNENRWKASGSCRATSLDPGRRATKYRLNFSERDDDVAVDSTKKQIAWVVARTPGRISMSFQLAMAREMICRDAFPISHPLFGGRERSTAKNPAVQLVIFSRATMSPSEDLMAGAGHRVKGAMTEENAEESEVVRMELETLWFGSDEFVQISLKACCAWCARLLILSISCWGRASRSFLTKVQTASFMVAGALERPDAAWSC